jgi:hypothetical protein
VDGTAKLKLCGSRYFTPPEIEGVKALRASAASEWDQKKNAHEPIQRARSHRPASVGPPTLGACRFHLPSDAAVLLPVST